MEVCRQYFMLFLNAVLLNSVENNLDRRRRERSCPKGYSRSRAKRGVRIQTATMRAWSDAPPPHGHAAWRGTECEGSVFRVKRKRERVPAKPIERHEEVVEERFRGAESSEALFHGA